MVIRVRGYLTYKHVIGDRMVEEPEGGQVTLRELLQSVLMTMQDQYSGVAIASIAGEGDQRVSILVNGRHHTHLPEGLDTLLKDGDEVAFFPPIVGG